METWLNVSNESDFSIYNLPFGIFSTNTLEKRIGIAFGDYIVDLYQASDNGLFDGIISDNEIFKLNYLNTFIALGKNITSKVRLIIQQELCNFKSVLINSPAIIEMTTAQMHLPVDVRDYTDFYSSIEHATNVGIMFRDPENALLPNWRHLPVGYHGRASSIVVSGTDVIRPKGQLKPQDGPPIFGASQRLDFELELAFIIGKNSTLGQEILIDKSEEYIFGLVLFNDWSARDIQNWEYVPLGPFLGKNFASSISAWVVTLEAIDYLKVNGPVQTPEVLPYLKSEGQKNYDIELSVSLIPKNGDENIICRSNFKYMYWNMYQQIAHHTINGCNVNIGDIMASGTISGKDPGSYGSMLELTWSGKNPIVLKDTSERKFLEDGDTIVIKGHGQQDGKRVGFGEVRGKIIPARFAK